MKIRHNLLILKPFQKCFEIYTTYINTFVFKDLANEVKTS